MRGTERSDPDRTPHMNTTTSTALSVRDPFALVPPLGNLDAYISAVNRIPLLTQEEETNLARQFRENGDLKAAGALVLSHLRVVVSVSGVMALRLRIWMPPTRRPSGAPVPVGVAPTSSRM